MAEGQTNPEEGFPILLPLELEQGQEGVAGHIPGPIPDITLGSTSAFLPTTSTGALSEQISMPAAAPGGVPSIDLPHTDTGITLTISVEEDIYKHLEDLSEQVLN